MGRRANAGRLGADPHYVPDDSQEQRFSGSTLTVSGLTGSLRGQSHVLATGEIIRPQFILADDPQHQGKRLFQDSNRAAARDHQRRLVGHGGTGRDGFLRRALHGHRPRRPGRPTLEPRQEPAMAGRAHARWFTLSRPPKSCGRQYRQLREDSFPHRRRRPRGHRLLPGAPRRDGRRRRRGVARAIQRRRGFSDPTRHEPEISETRRLSWPKCRTTPSPRRLPARWC